MMRLTTQLAIVTALCAVALGVAGWRSGELRSLWLTPDQQGRLAYERLEFSAAADLFDDPMWKGTAAGQPFGLPGKGRPLEFRLLHVLQFTDEGQIKRESVWVDLAAIIRQLPSE